MNNIRIYGIYAYDDDIIAMDKNKISDEEFISMAEEQGLVWSLKGFENAFNSSDISDTWYIRIINHKTN